MAETVQTKPAAEQPVQKDTKTKRFDSIYMAIGVCATLVVLVLLSGILFKSNFIMFHPTRVAEQYCATAILAKDDFNALKYTTMIQSNYLGDYFRSNYVQPNLATDVTAKTRTPEELGALKGALREQMDAYYAEIIAQNTEKTLDTVLSLYTQQYAAEYTRVFEEPPTSEDDMVECFEASVKAYSTANAIVPQAVSSAVTHAYTAAEIETYKASLSEAALEEYAAFSIDPADISDVCEVTYTYKDNDTEKTGVCTLVQIGMQWYVDIATL